MFKDFHKRLQRDLKKIVDTRVILSEARLNGEIRVRVIRTLNLFKLIFIFLSHTRMRNSLI